MSLEVELKFFEKNRDRFAKHHLGKFALVKGERAIDFFDTDVNAFEAGVRCFGRDPFLIKKIEAGWEQTYRLPD